MDGTRRRRAGTRFAEAGQFVPFDKELGYRAVDALRVVAGRHGVSCARVALAWVLSRPAVSSAIIAARKAENLEDNIAAVDLVLSEDDIRLLDDASDPGSALSEVDGSPTRHRRRPEAQGAASRALRGRGSMEGSARNKMVGLRASLLERLENPLPIWSRRKLPKLAEEFPSGRGGIYHWSRV